MANFIFDEIELKGALLVNNFYVEDERGCFSKTFEQDIYKEKGINFKIDESFFSISKKNVIRGMHLQTNNPQAKLVCVLSGRIFDVIVDLRPNSRTFKKWAGFELSSENHLAIFIPKGFAHGFLSLDDDTIVLYQCDGKYDQETDTGIYYNDSELGIKWPLNNNEKPIMSKRDSNFVDINTFLILNNLENWY